MRMKYVDSPGYKWQDSTVCLGTAEKHGYLEHGRWWTKWASETCEIASCLRQRPGYQIIVWLLSPTIGVFQTTLSHMARVWRDDNLPTLESDPEGWAGAAYWIDLANTGTVGPFGFANEETTP